MSPELWPVRNGVFRLVRPLVMGVLNTTPDSFSDGGSYLATGEAVRHGRRLVAEGADIIDVGGESTRPGAEPVPPEVELRRVLPVVEELAAGGAVVSIDTMKPEVAGACIEAGARIVNDVTGLESEEMSALVAESGAGVVIMHMRGTPRTMQDAPEYGDVVGEVVAFLEGRMSRAVRAGVDVGRIAVDPGIGFGKTVEHNLTLLDRLGDLGELGRPIVVGTSRKRFLGEITGRADPAERDDASAVSAALAVMRGAHVVRVHDVASTREAVRVAWAIVRRQHEDVDGVFCPSVLDPSNGAMS